jgi:hydroxypyruvate reductase
VNSETTLLTALFEAAVGAAAPEAALRDHMPAPPKGRTVVIGAGKGAAQLASAFERHWEASGNGRLSGLVITRYGYSADCNHIQIIEAAHPLPDSAGLAASRAILTAVDGLSAEDLVVALICGGGSSLLPYPPAGLTLDDERAMNEALLASGAPISAMNAIRKQVSGIKGGRLAAAAQPARVLSLIVSDVPGDEPAQVASGPTVPNWVTLQDALNAIQRYRIALPDRVMAYLHGNPAPAPQPTDRAFARNQVKIIASAGQSLDAAARKAEAEGLPAVILAEAIEGEAREVARVQAAIAREVAIRNRPFSKPVVILSGGETTVTLPSRAEYSGKGGPNSEFLLALGLELEGVSGVTALAADSDGIDGTEHNAGAFLDSTSIARMRAAGRDPIKDLLQHDAFSAFEAVGDLFCPGPSGTNVNDFRAIVVR